ncbi:iron complex transport system substrate-binding protein [Picosynechococcus sp. OG1]|nr:Periplasmic binding protein [Picosynechococcus sp. PCC 7002]SMH47922.1 iron complex transport system substrate-binding protein [Picosynechococcus sp. OG1]SMQ81119.1 iron complex transport system substrate-binding protein [Synechococcus sp. 7002]
MEFLYRAFKHQSKSYYWRFSLLLFLSCSLVIGCYSDGVTRVGETQECRPIEHALGETCVPLAPERIITLSNAALDSVLVLEMQPVGTISNTPELLRQRVQGAEIVGMEGSANLEKILSLQPDLILGAAYSDGAIYEQLSQIAPTVLEGAETNGEWQDILLLNAEALGKQDRAQALLAEYQRRLDLFREKMGERLTNLEVSLVRIYPDRISVYLKNSFAGTILQDAGLARPDYQDRGVFGEHPFQEVISKEELQRADGDVLFVWTFGATPEISRSAQAALETFKQDPLWLQLQAVQNNKVYEIDAYWNVPSLIAANAVVDDLFYYLLEQE